MIKITPPKEEDAEGIEYVRVKAWQSAYKELIDSSFLESMFDNKNLKIDNCKKRIKEDLDKFIIYAAKDEDKVVGFVWGGESRENNSENQSEIYAYYVSPDRHSEGIGKELFKAFLEESIKRNMNTMILWCLHGNKTQEIYKHFGGVFVKSKMTEIPKNSGVEYKEDMFIYDDLQKVLENIK